jgi:hypothetical protein
LLNLSFYFLTLADAFTIFVAVGTLGTVLLGRAALGVSEGLSRREMLTGMIALLGVAIIARSRGASDVADAAAASLFSPAGSGPGIHLGLAPPSSPDTQHASTGTLLAAPAEGAPQIVPTAGSRLNVVGWGICIMGGVASAGFNLFTCAAPGSGAVEDVAR